MIPAMVLATTAAGADVAPVLLGLAVILVGAKLGGEICERLRQPAVLGELLVGVALGNAQILGFDGLQFLQGQEALAVLAELGIILLLFEVGSETTVSHMLRVGPSALLVAAIGVAAPSILGFLTARLFFPEESVYAHVFVGAILCATSVGITARVLRDLGRAQTAESKIVLGAAVIDDVLGLIVLAAVSGLIVAANAGRTMGAGAVLGITGKALLFLVLSTAAGLWLSPRVFRWGYRLRSRGVLLATSLSLCFVMAYLSYLAGLAPIVGAFTAGLILRNGPFERLAEREGVSFEQLLHPITGLLLPVFFVLMGLRVNLDAFAQPQILAFAGVLCVAAVAGKLVCGIGVLGRGVDRLAVGLGMIPRGEVGLIFAGVGTSLLLSGQPVVTRAIFSGAVIMVMVTTLVTPPLLSWRMGRKRSPDEEGYQEGAYVGSAGRHDPPSSTG